MPLVACTLEPSTQTLAAEPAPTIDAPASSPMKPVTVLVSSTTAKPSASLVRVNSLPSMLKVPEVSIPTTSTVSTTSMNALVAIVEYSSTPATVPILSPSRMMLTKPSASSVSVTPIACPLTVAVAGTPVITPSTNSTPSGAPLLSASATPASVKVVPSLS